MRVTVVVPFYNEESNVLQVAGELLPIAECDAIHEALFVDDGSTDETWRQIMEAHKRFPFIHGLRHVVNLGQSAAMMTGLEHATGDILITMDGDLQNDPADIPLLVKQVGDADCVCGYRQNRQDTWSKRWASLLANRIRRYFTRDAVRDTGCSLKAFRRECLADLPHLKGFHRFMPAYFSLNGRRVVEIPVNHRKRQFGVSKYTNWNRLPSTVRDLIGFCWYKRRFFKRSAVETTTPFPPVRRA